MIAMSSKPLGYARTLIIAWAFGTSPGMDAFHLASGIIALFAGSIGSALESSVLPELVRIREQTGDHEACGNVAAFISCILFAATALFVAALIIAPGLLVRFFARGFDTERIRMGAIMLWWLIPFAVITIYKPMIDIWANFTERYTLASIISAPFNFILIPLLLAGIPFIGVYSVAFSLSAGHAILVTFTIAALRGIPMFWRRGKILWGSLIRIAHNSTFTMAIIASNTLYVIVDRYFASTLPTGSVAAISYASILTGVMYSITGTPMMFFLSKMSKLALTEKNETNKMLENAVSLSMAYLIPTSVFIMVSSRPVISMIFGWGNFDANSIDMTSICLASYSIGFSFSVASSCFYRYALARQRLGIIVILSYISVMMNGLLDWVLVTRWGLLGLTLATSLTQILGFILSYVAFFGWSFHRYIIRMRFFEQTALSCLFACFAWFAGTYGTAAHLAAAIILFPLCLAASEKTGLMKNVPEHWHPSHLAAFLASALKSYIRSK
ncbi:MAG: hypothetical protein LBT23_07375 [Synergistaceae bacterium]|nr:hypothetical protein [Synergistaceae bacterium]